MQNSANLRALRAHAPYLSRAIRNPVPRPLRASRTLSSKRFRASLAVCLACSHP